MLETPRGSHDRVLARSHFAGHIFDRACYCGPWRRSACALARMGRSRPLAARASVGLGKYHRLGFRNHLFSSRSSDARRLATHGEHFSISLLVRVRIPRCGTERLLELPPHRVGSISGGIRDRCRDTHPTNRATAQRAPGWERVSLLSRTRCHERRCAAHYCVPRRLSAPDSIMVRPSATAEQKATPT
jgi:hypothetical protein